MQWGRKVNHVSEDDDDNGEDDGTFWVKFEDFVRLFDNLDVCRVSEWNELRLGGRINRSNYTSQTFFYQTKWIYSLEIPSKTHIIVGVHQEDKR